MDAKKKKRSEVTNPDYPEHAYTDFFSFQLMIKIKLQNFKYPHREPADAQDSSVGVQGPSDPSLGNSVKLPCSIRLVFLFSHLLYLQPNLCGLLHPQAVPTCSASLSCPLYLLENMALFHTPPAHKGRFEVWGT